ncbi:MAG TPA: TetR/AcrR family transcriptional regulator [Actinophytocola sp.]|uniref:TetR/AcrR family transcriptional regulator n=1 Tax=Actinophytocola sp. TaxID=1872138 RepID=UPI002DB5883F|nr:TetR/AcrR family transcriptional regulator [Actinophytocola sp.]HEU5475526.1 TetR/AcrR family transcriptional regulator [Actinophytocola sp.]
MGPIQGTEQLPRGRHGLSREQVVASQRTRMLTAMTAAVARKGYAHTSVADVIAGAGVSRETFYEQFSSKEDCFLAAYDHGVRSVRRAVSNALTEAPSDPAERYSHALAAYLRTLSLDEGIARTFNVEVYAAGPAAIARRMALMDQFVEITAGILEARTPEDRFACEALVAAISSLVTNRVGTGQTACLPSLHEPLMALVRRAVAAWRV